MTAGSLISVIIPTYKRAALVQRAIASVRQQTYRNLEILVVDDASPDDTASVVRAIPEPRIRYIRHEKNKGLPAVRNTGIRAARGELIAFLDDDDEWRNDKLEKQVRAMKGYDAVLCTGVSNGYPQRVHDGPDVTLDDLKKGSFNPSALLAKAEVLRVVMFDESLKQGEDWDAFIRIAQRHSIAWVREPLLLYNDGSHKRMTNEARYLSGSELEKRTAMLQKHREFFGERLFMLHMADTLLSYMGSRPDKLQALAYAVKRCGFIPVLLAVVDKVRLKFQRRMWSDA